MVLYVLIWGSEKSMELCSCVVGSYYACKIVALFTLNVSSRLPDRGFLAALSLTLEVVLIATS
jgi:hypothetical protein